MGIEIRKDVGPIRRGSGEAGRIWGYIPFCMCCIQGDLKASRSEFPAENTIVWTEAKLFLLLLSSRYREWTRLPKEECRARSGFERATFRCFLEAEEGKASVTELAA